MTEEPMIPYVVIKFSNGDIVLGEYVEETAYSMVVRYPIHVRKVFVTNEHGVKVQKKIATKYCELARKNEIFVQKASCNYIAPLRDEDRKYYDVLVTYNFFKKSEARDEPEEDVKPAEEPEKESLSIKPTLH